MRSTSSFVRGAGVLMATAVLTFGAAKATAADKRGSACPTSTDDAYVMTARALTGPTSTDLALQVAARPGCGPVTSVKHLQLETYTASRELADVQNLHDVDAPGGVVPIVLERVERGARIEAQAQVQTEAAPRTYVVRAETTSLLRPDLLVQSVQAPRQTLATRPVAVTAEIVEANGDAGATARVALAGGGGPLGEPVEVTVPPGGRVSVTFPNVALTLPVPFEVTAVVTDAAPAEYDATNDSRSAVVEVTKNEIGSRLLVPSLGGF